MRGPRQTSIRGERPADRLAVASVSPSARVARRVNDTERAPGQPADREGRHSRAGKRKAVDQNAQRQTSRARSEPGRGADAPPQPRRARHHALSCVTRYSSSLLVDRVEVHGHASPASRDASSLAKTRAPTIPNSSAPVIRIPVPRITRGFGGGQRRRDTAAVVPGAGRLTLEPATPGERTRDDARARAGRPATSIGEWSTEPHRRQRDERGHRHGQAPRPRPAARPSTGPAPWYRGAPRSNG